MPALLREMVAARGDSNYQKMIVASSKTNLLILDDWGLKNCHRRQDPCGILQTPVASCPGHPAHITGLGGPLQMECMAHFTGIRTTSRSPRPGWPPIASSAYT
ncbi:hypothetical protein DFAR_200018 [Desulfarculales bacterium]